MLVRVMALEMCQERTHVLYENKNFDVKGCEVAM